MNSRQAIQRIHQPVQGRRSLVRADGCRHVLAKRVGVPTATRAMCAVRPCNGLERPFVITSPRNPGDLAE